MYLKITALVILVIGCLTSSAQTETKAHTQNIFISARTSAGWVLQTNDFLKGKNNLGKPIKWFDAQLISLGVQTNGDKEWHHVLNFPYYGIALYNMGCHETDEMGRPLTFFGYMGFPIQRKKEYSFGYELDFGLATNWKEYNINTNPNNITIGSNSTVYIGANLYCMWNLDSRWQLKTGLGFTHFSNGAIKKPNKGLNVAAPFVELNYSLHDRPELIRHSVEKYQGHKEVAMHFGYTRKQEEYKSANENIPSTIGTFDAYNISVAWLKQSTWKNKYGFGTDIGYDTQGGLTTRTDNNGAIILDKASGFSNNFKLGIYGTYEFCIDRLSVASSLGAYLYKTDYPHSPPLIYQRIGLKYHLQNDIYMAVLVRAHNFSVADLLEFCIGYRIKW